jgi:hypothetical protein
MAAAAAFRTMLSAMANFSQGTFYLQSRVLFSTIIQLLLLLRNRPLSRLLLW